ncbi:uncharacterized protein LOC115214815 [Octopus sinensis]|uniref:Uncharacterized protein LOC115214815 n=1 Tax=Octopus sinensis TaxID=2607531 RepID=A0A6P7SN31_9MOLL|nr:uncharacterized protein LOC115214815 [Octopus sinensis]
MPKTRVLSECERGQIVAHHEDGMSQRQIAQKMKCSRCAVQTTLKRFRETKDVKTIQRTGRKKVTSPRDDRSIIRQSLRNKRKTSLELFSDFNEASTSQISRTLRRKLVEYGLKGCKASKKPWVSKSNMEKRLQWAKKPLKLDQ